MCSRSRRAARRSCSASSRCVWPDLTLLVAAVLFGVRTIDLRSVARLARGPSSRRKARLGGAIPRARGDVDCFWMPAGYALAVALVVLAGVRLGGQQLAG